MMVPQSPPNYPHSPLQQLPSLALALGLSLERLAATAQVADSKYRLATAITKSDGSIRQPFDALPPLKEIQKRIKLKILDRVIYPDYLTGSLKGQDPIKNAQIHAGAKITICEDIKGFFPSATQTLVKSVWLEFFGFSEAVSTLLTKLTVKDGALPQGAATSSHIANLIFWKREHQLYKKLHSAGIAYSRYVDDITVSSRVSLTPKQTSSCIAQIFGMMASAGFRPKRQKQEIQRAHSTMRATKLLVNRRPALSNGDRQAIRAALHQLECKCEAGTYPELEKELNSVSGRISRLSQMHPSEGKALKVRAKRIRVKFASE